MRNNIILSKIDNEYGINRFYNYELYWTFDLKIGNKIYSQVYIK